MSPKGTASRNLSKSRSNRSTYLLGALAIVVIAAIVIGGVIWESHRNQTHNEGYGSVQNPNVSAELQPDGSVRLGLPDAAKTIDVFEDPLCPFCAQLEQKHGQEIAQAIDQAKLAVHYHMLNFLDSLSASGDYSTRAVAATQCVAATGSGVAYARFRGILFTPENLPKERGTSDHSNDDLANMARDAGADDHAVTCIREGQKVQSAAKDGDAARQQMMAAGGRGTPAVFVGTTEIDPTDPNWVANLL